MLVGSSRPKQKYSRVSKVGYSKIRGWTLLNRQCALGEVSLDRVRQMDDYLREGLV